MKTGAPRSTASPAFLLTTTSRPPAHGRVPMSAFLAAFLWRTMLMRVKTAKVLSDGLGKVLQRAVWLTGGRVADGVRTVSGSGLG